MKKFIYSLTCLLVLQGNLHSEHCNAQNALVISNLTYDSITQTGVTIFWTTNVPSDSKIRWMAPDSNYQALIFTDSIYLSSAVNNHVVPIGNLLPATIYKYQVISTSATGTNIDSGYFVTQSTSSGTVEVYFNHTVDTSVSTGEKANGSQSFETLLDNQINKATHSIDMTLWSFEQITSVAEALINAKNRGVKIRFVYNSTGDTPLIDSLRVHGIPVLKRNFDTTFSMHNKFWVFDYRYNINTNTKYLWTGSTNVTHPQFHSDRNNVILIQDESLCAVYTREFEQMWGSHTDMYDLTRAKFGPKKTDNVPHILNVAGTRMEVYFSPVDSVSSVLCNLIQTKTTKSLFFCMYKFVLPTIEDALHTIFRDGKEISGVFDSSNSVKRGCAYPQMKGISDSNTWNPHADVFLDTIPGLLHHKYFIIDANSQTGNKIAVTGSFNWETPACTGNDENFLIIYNARINNLYYQEFQARYKESGGSLIGYGIEDTITNIPSGFSLSQNYPNPFSLTTNIEYYITQTSQVKIIVYDMLGCEVQTLINKTLAPGTYQSTFDGSALSSGVYFYRMVVNGPSETKSMMLKR